MSKWESVEEFSGLNAWQDQETTEILSIRRGEWWKELHTGYIAIIDSVNTEAGTVTYSLKHRAGITKGIPTFLDNHRPKDHERVRGTFEIHKAPLHKLQYTFATPNICVEAPNAKAAGEALRKELLVERVWTQVIK